MIDRMIGDSTGLRSGATAYVAADEVAAVAVESAGNQIRPEDKEL